MAGKWALLIGIDRYHESLGSLKYAGADCRLLRDTLVNGPLGFPEDQVLLLDDTQDAEHRPTFANIHSVLGSWLAAPGDDVLVLVFFAGHGRLVDGSTYLAPGDATLASIHTLGIPLRYVQDVMERCKARRKLLVVDACHSGAGRDVAVMSTGMQEALAGGSGFYTIASCGPEELSHEWVEKGQGVFTHFLAEALRGGCSPAADGKLTLDRVYEWVHDHVAKWAAQHRCSQTPQRFARGAGDIILAECAPDYEALAEQYRKELDAAKARLAEKELRETRDRLENDRPIKNRKNIEQLAQSFLAENCNLHGAALLVKWKKFVSQNTDRNEIGDMDVNEILLAEKGKLGNTCVVEEGHVSLRLVFVPPNVKASIYVDEEAVTLRGNSLTISRGRHDINVIPVSLEWGSLAFRFDTEALNQNKLVVRFRRTSSWRALLSFLCVIGIGGIIASLGLLLPEKTAFDFDPIVGGGGQPIPISVVYLLVGIFFNALPALIYAWLLIGIIRMSRGIRFLMVTDPAIRLSPPDGLLGLLAIFITYFAWALGFLCPLQYVFMGWALVLALVAGVLFCLVPWHGHYRDRDII